MKAQILTVHEGTHTKPKLKIDASNESILMIATGKPSDCAHATIAIFFTRLVDAIGSIGKGDYLMLDSTEKGDKEIDHQFVFVIKNEYQATNPDFKALNEAMIALKGHASFRHQDFKWKFPE